MELAQGLPRVSRQWRFNGPRETLRAAFKHQLIKDDEGWMMMLADSRYLALFAALFMDQDITGVQLMRIANDIDELPMLYSVDLSLFPQIDNPALTEHILRVGKVFYRAATAS
jgi:hypothetical protein